MIGQAIRLIISAANIVIVPFMTGLDVLSYALTKAATISKQSMGWTKLLMKKILSMLGHTLSETANFTVEFMKWVFQLLARAIYRTVGMAIRLTQ